jgi:hypothetical protein
LDFDSIAKILQFKEAIFLASQLGWNEYKYEQAFQYHDLSFNLQWNYLDFLFIVMYTIRNWIVE